MESTKQIEGNVNPAQSCCAPAGKSGWFSSRNVLIAGIVLAVAAGLFFGWNWIAAAGVASLILGILPCLAMCALGLCMNRMGKKDAPTSEATVPATGTQIPEKRVA